MRFRLLYTPKRPPKRRKPKVRFQNFFENASLSKRSIFRVARTKLTEAFKNDAEKKRDILSLLSTFSNENELVWTDQNDAKALLIGGNICFDFFEKKTETLETH